MKVKVKTKKESYIFMLIQRLLAYKGERVKKG